MKTRIALLAAALSLALAADAGARQDQALMIWNCTNNYRTLESCSSCCNSYVMCEPAPCYPSPYRSACVQACISKFMVGPVEPAPPYVCPPWVCPALGNRMPGKGAA